jgi:hypothetical protein
MWSGTIILLNMFNELASYIQSCGKISIFAPEMKKFTHIMLSLLLSLALLFIGSGVNITRCAHTGTVKMMTVFSNGAMSDMSCSMNSPCMTVEHFELSPTNMAQTVSYDFHVIQPLLATLPSFVAEWLLPIENKVEVQYYPDVWKSPPRDYLNFIQVLLI